MKKYTILICFCLSLLASSAQNIKQLQEETQIKVAIKQAISSKDAKVGDIINFKVIEQVKKDDLILIDTGTIVTGEVIEAEKSRSLGKGGKLDFIINTVTAVDGQLIKVRVSSKKMTGQKTTGGVVAAAIIFSPLALFLKGKNVVIEAGKEFLVYADNNYDIQAN
jgi:hypothetical protein